jgi:hypothetical protein
MSYGFANSCQWSLRDAIVIGKALDLGKILLTLNGDFADIVTFPPSRYKGIVALQVHNHPEIIPRLLARLSAYLSAQPSMEDYGGKLFVVEVNRIRIRE